MYEKLYMIMLFTPVQVRLVTDTLSGVSKGYGFVEFPYRRAVELAFIW
jgi:RNA recognition motif-containing protein